MTSHARSAHIALHILSGHVQKGGVLDAAERHELAMVRAYAEHLLEGKSLDPADVYTTAVQWAAYPEDARAA